jgi:hypothetical protein
MNLINKQVIHKSFGKGSVVEYTDSCIEVHFECGNKKFTFPDAIGTYLTLIDQKAASSIRKIIEKKELESQLEELELEKERVIQREEEQHLLARERLMKNFKIHPSSQAAFWCDEEEQSKVFTEWKIFAGVTKRGVNQGQPNRLNRLNHNSACILTARDPNMQEKDRCIVGIYMVEEDFVGKLCEDGYIPAHSEYRIQLSKEESQQILFWNYYANEKNPKNMTWNTGKYRYFDNIWIAQILKDIIALKKDAKERKLAKQFLKYFCNINKITEKELSNPNGSLMRI